MTGYYNVQLFLICWKDVQYKCTVKMSPGISTGPSLLIHILPKADYVKVSLFSGRNLERSQTQKGTNCHLVYISWIVLYILPWQLNTVKLVSTEYVERMFSVSVL